MHSLHNFEHTHIFRYNILCSLFAVAKWRKSGPETRRNHSSGDGWRGTCTFLWFCSDSIGTLVWIEYIGTLTSKCPNMQVFGATPWSIRVIITLKANFGYFASWIIIKMMNNDKCSQLIYYPCMWEKRATVGNALSVIKWVRQTVKHTNTKSLSYTCMSR